MPDGPDRPSVEERLERLERIVAELRVTVGRLAGSGPAGSTGGAATPATPRAADGAPGGGSTPAEGQSEPRRALPPMSGDWFHHAEGWVGKAGVLLLLLGLAYLFRYTIDQGWVTPAVRVAFGLVLASALLGLGLAFRRSRPGYSQVLQGGALGVYYFTIYAAFSFYGMIGQGPAFVGLSAVAALALWLATAQAEVTLAHLGAIGGFSAPLLFENTHIGVGALVGYGTLVLAWTGWIYAGRGWRSLVWTLAIGGAALAFVAAGQAGEADRALVTAALPVVWITGGLLPLLREHLRLRDPARWTRPPLNRVIRETGVSPESLDRGVAQLLLLLVSLYLVWLTAAIWDLGREPAGTVALGGAALLAVLATYDLYAHPRLFRIPAPPAAGLLLVGTGLAAARNAAFALFGLEALAAILIARVADRRARTIADHRSPIDVGAGRGPETGEDAALSAGGPPGTDPEGPRPGVRGAGSAIGDRRSAIGSPAPAGEPGRELRTLAHAVFIILGIWLLTGADAAYRPEDGLLTWGALGRLAAIGAALAASFVLRDGGERRAYRLGALAGFLVWLWIQLMPLPNGQALVSVAWGTVAIVLLLSGHRRGHGGLQRTGLATLGLVVAKLLALDLDRVGTVWRILLFMGFGGAFLALSYLLGSGSAHESGGEAAGPHARAGGRTER